MASPAEENNPFLNFTDADLTAALLRAMRTVGILALAGAPIFWIVVNWRTACLYLVGAAISAAGIFESQRLVTVVNAKLDLQKSPRATGLVVVLFFLRLGIAAGLLYVTLKYVDGSVYGMIAGLALAMIALSLEAFRLTRT